MRSLTRLLPTQVAERWALISQSMGECKMFDPLMPLEDQRNNMLQVTLAGGVDVWSGFEEEKFAGFVFTTITKDSLTLSRQFVVLGVWTPSGFTDAMFYQCLHTLTTYAKAQGCKRLITFTDKKDLVQRLKNLGGYLKAVEVAFDF